MNEAKAAVTTISVKLSMKLKSEENAGRLRFIEDKFPIAFNSVL